MVSNSENDPTKEGGSYAVRLQELSNMQRATFLDMHIGGKKSYSAGEGNVQRLPLTVSIDGAPMDVLFTVSVGGTMDEAGRKKPAGPLNRNGVQNAVDMAAKNFAVIRTPYTNEQSRLIELTAEDIAVGRCDFRSDAPTVNDESSRVFAPLPGMDESALEIIVPVSNEPWEAPVQLSFQTDGNQNLQFGRHGHPHTYAMIATQV